MTAVDHLRKAYTMTFEGQERQSPGVDDMLDPEKRRDFAAEYLENLKLVAEVIEAPDEPDISEDLSFAILNRQAPIEERRWHAARAVDNAKATLFTQNLSDGIDLPAAYERSEALSSQMVDAVIVAASSYPEIPDISALKENLSGVVDGEQSTEKTVTSALAMFNVLQPYIVDRLLELNVYDPDELREQVARLRYDGALVLRFYRSVSGVSKAALTGNTTKSNEELANELFDLGPIFMQLGQTLSAAATKVDTDTKKDKETREFLHNIGSAMQEGVAMPSAEQQVELAKQLPSGLTLEEALSGAKMAYVFRTSNQDGETYATKIKRPGVERAAVDNVRMFNLMTNIVARYVETHAAETKVAKNLNIVKDSLPFGLALIEADITSELDFEEEARAQRQAKAVMARHKGIIVPEVIQEYSDGTHITMEHVPGERISKVAANPGYIENALKLLLQGRKGLFHGDMHGGNVKAAVDAEPGALAVYDWGGSFEVPKRFERKLLSFFVGIARKNPKKIAKAYRHIQSTEFNQVTQEEAEQAAAAAIAAAAERPYKEKNGRPPGRLGKRMQDANSIFSTYIGLLGKEYQSTLDARYLRYIRSNKALLTVIKQELAKPEYNTSKVHRNIVLAKSTARAVKDVYLPRRRQ